MKMLLAIRWPLETGCIINLRAMLPGAVLKTRKEILNWNTDAFVCFKENMHQFKFSAGFKNYDCMLKDEK